MKRLGKATFPSASPVTSTGPAQPSPHTADPCQATTTFENSVNGHFLTDGGITNQGQNPNPVENLHPDSTFAHALWTTIYISVVAQAAGILLGLLAALARMSRFFPFRLISGVYVLIFRGTPVLVQIFFFYLAVPLPTVRLGFGMRHAATQPQDPRAAADWQP